ncbi:hypothetical protein HDV01_004394 [Terramyces sp. JEL0728]|nr:hypothetical protein HDV01_004394 [Terramyces sp. JEL0728]
MLERLIIELDTIAMHLDCASYLDLRCSFYQNLPVVPVLSAYAYKSELYELQYYDVYSHESKRYPISLHPDHYSDTTFDFAVSKSHYDIVKKILDSRKVSKETLKAIIQTYLDENYTKPQIGWEIVKFMIQHFNGDYNQMYNSLLAFRAVMYGFPDIILGTMNLPLVQSIHTFNDGFISVCESGTTEIVKVLLDNRLVNVNYRDPESLCTGLLCAGMNANKEIVELLLNIPETQILNGDLSHMMTYWTDHDLYFELFLLLLNEGRCMWDEMDNRPIELLCKIGLTKGVELLLKKPRVQVTVNAIRAAAKRKNMDLLAYLLQNYKHNPFPQVMQIACQFDNLIFFLDLLKDPRAPSIYDVIVELIRMKSNSIIRYILENNMLSVTDGHYRNLFACYAIRTDTIDLLFKILQTQPLVVDNRLLAYTYEAAMANKLTTLQVLLLQDNLWEHQVWEKMALKVAKQNHWKFARMCLCYPYFNPSYKYNSLLKLAADYSNTQLLDLIINHPNFKYNNDDSVFQLLMRKSDVKTTKFLMAKLDYDPGQKANLLFRNACRYSNERFIQYLLTLDSVNPQALGSIGAQNLVSRGEESLVGLLTHPKFWTIDHIHILFNKA